MKKKFKEVLLAAVFFCCAGQFGSAWAVPAAPIVHELDQAGGTKIKAVKWGDEHRHGWETAEGYAIGFDPQQKAWKYIGRDAAGKPTLLPERPNLDRVPAGLERRAERAAAPVELKRPSTQVAALLKSLPQTVAANIPVILVNFKDTTPAFTVADFNSMIFGAGTFSVKDYYEEVSYGAFTVSPGPSGIAGWYSASQNHDYYGENYPDSINGGDRYPGTLVREAVAAADAAGFDFASYDQDEDGHVDVVAIVHQGRGEEASGSATDIWSHSWSLNSAYVRGRSVAGAYTTNDGIIVNNYIIMPEKLAGGISTMGVFAHEYGHALGLPDLYDTDRSSAGAGNWSLMAGGSWNGDSRIGDRPAHLDAWCKYALGWVTPSFISAAQDNITIAQASDSQDVYQLLPGSPVAGGEYFLVENRQKTADSFDYALPGAGLLIWHIDEAVENRIWGTINDSECYPVGSAGCASTHYHVALMQADGLWGLEKGDSRGDAGDPFPGDSCNTVFDYTSSPCSRLWSGLPSNVSISGISDSGSLMSFSFSNSSTTTTTAVDDNDCNPEISDDCREKCFFASVLGRDNPRLAAARAFRDTTLSKTAVGRALIRLYYRKAELINYIIERNPRCKAAVKKLLEMMIP